MELLRHMAFTLPSRVHTKRCRSWLRLSARKSIGIFMSFFHFFNLIFFTARIPAAGSLRCACRFTCLRSFSLVLTVAFVSTSIAHDYFRCEIVSVLYLRGDSRTRNMITNVLTSLVALGCHITIECDGIHATATRWTYATIIRRKCRGRKNSVALYYTVSSKRLWLSFAVFSTKARMRDSLHSCGGEFFFSTQIINLDEKCKLLWTILKFIKIVCHKNMWVFSLAHSLRTFANCCSAFGLGHAACRKQDFFFFSFVSDGRVHVLVACWRRRGRRLPSLFCQNEFLIVIYLVPFRCGNNMTCCSHVLSLRRHRFLFPPTVPFRVLSTSRALPAPAHTHTITTHAQTP